MPILEHFSQFRIPAQNKTGSMFLWLKKTVGDSPEVIELPPLQLPLPVRPICGLDC